MACASFLLGIQRLEKVLADNSYQGLEAKNDQIKIEITSKPSNTKGFVPLHKRWVVERTFAWLDRQRRLCRDYEVRVENQKAMIFIGMSKIMLNKLTKKADVKIS